MARRRRLVAPDQSELEKLDEGFAAKPPLGQSMTPPIAQVAGEAAVLAGMANVTDRVAAAKDAADAKDWRAAYQDGRVVQQISVDDIELNFLSRDRVFNDVEERKELIGSIMTHGLRTPIEVTPTKDGYGLISGNRRLTVFRMLALKDPEFSKIPAFVRTHKDRAQAYLSMVEENEIRANLSHYERGRISVLATQQGVYGSVSEAVNHLFGQASKAKRSKVRSFAAVHEALGDLLGFPLDLTERTGLRIAAALRSGGQAKLRSALAGFDPKSAAQELKRLETALSALENTEKDPTRGGRPSEVTKLPKVTLPGGGDLRAQVSAQGLKIDVKGREVSSETAREILAKIAKMLH
ncbi:ParB N-terminal domain-containing protein [Cognatishimia sp. WU-CL00825]|uniref:ParB/RepB/Spo0J family partition protein n=1 Tax=Cognatishimia sp. WU-CL00825 TaxID=3127658 RepID=UPI003106227A